MMEERPGSPTTRVRPYERCAAQYDAWFDAHRHAYQSEVQAIRSLLPPFDEAIEVGVGTGRFAAPFHIGFGLDPARAPLMLARRPGLRLVQGVAERLPVANAGLDLVLMVTAIAFLESVERAFAEVYRALRPGGHLVAAFIDRASTLGRIYEQHKDADPFYRVARFRSATEVADRLEAAGFTDLCRVQTIFDDPAEMKGPDPVRSGHGDGVFAVVRGRK